MQISLYIGTRKRKDRVVNEELVKYIEGDRSDRIKDLILKGLMYEGRKDIDQELLDIRYMTDMNFQQLLEQKNKLNKKFVYNKDIENTNEDIKPDFTKMRVKRNDKILDEELESRI